MNKWLLSFLILVTAIGTGMADVWTIANITSDTTWVRNNNSGDGVYVIDLTTDSMTIDAGVTLTIEPGVQVRFHDDIYFYAYGTIKAIGTENDSIVFTIDRNAGSAGEWGGLKLMGDNSTANQLIYCRIEYGDADTTDLSAPAALNNGGGIFCAPGISATTEIKHCTIQNNSAYQAGGGIFVYGSPTIEATSFHNNVAGLFGGAIAIQGNIAGYASPVIQNNLIYTNSASGTGGGGGIAILGLTSAAITNNLIYGNSASVSSGGGIYVEGSNNAGTSVTNSVIWGNTANNGNQILDNQTSGTFTVEYSDVQGGYAGTGNIDADPQFNDAANGNFHVEATSPIVDTGTSSGAPLTDFDGNNRPFDGDRDGTDEVDMGAYEYINTAPVITSTPVTSATEDQVYTYNVVAEDPDAAEQLTYVLLQAPSFLSINGSTGEISGTPTTDSDAGDYSVRVRVYDRNAAADTQSYTLRVTAVNDLPVVSDIPDQTIDEGQNFATINLDEYVTDEETPDSDINWTYSGNSELLVTIDNNRVATISTPNADWNGSETITFTATDAGGASDSDAATFVVVNINDAPVVSDIPDQTIEEGAVFTQINLDTYVDDVDNSDADMTWTYSGNSELQVSIDANRIATISAPNADWYGSETITFTATDPGNLSDSDPATFTITAVNDAPVVEGIPDQTITEGESFAAITLDDYATDVDDPDSALTWTYSGNSALTVTIDENRIAYVATPDENWNGSETIVFTATDTSGASDADTVEFTVQPANDPPVVSGIADQTVAEGSDFSTIQLDLYVDDIDNNDEEMTWSVTGNTNLLVQIDSLTRVATVFAADSNWYGSEILIFTATDPGGLADSDTAVFEITPVNDAPQVAEIPDQTITEGDVFQPIALDDYVNDVDDPDSNLTWTYSGNNELLVDIDANRVATISIPSEEWNGSERILFTVTDTAGLDASTYVTFTVEAVNDTPQIVSPLPELFFAEDGSLLYATSNWYPYVHDNDNPDSTLEYTVRSGNWVSATADSAGFLFNAPENWFGVDTLMLTVSDGFSADSSKFVVRVQSVNDVPVISNLPDSVHFRNDSSFVLIMGEYVSDVETPDSLLAWEFAVSNDSLKVAYNANTTELTLEAPDFSGIVELICTVKDDSNATAVDTILVDVSTATAIADGFDKMLPKTYSLGQNYPNPFNPSTRIKYALPKAGKVRIEVYNITGSKVAVLVDEYKQAGVYVAEFRAGNLASGLYFYRIQAGTFSKVKRMILLK